MAGNYNDVPGRRMAWDLDGTICYYALQSGTPGAAPPINTPPPLPYIAASLAQRQIANNENVDITMGTGFANYPWAITSLLFPEDRDIDGWYENVRQSSEAWEAYSLDTTNLIDGTWNTAAVTATTSVVLDHYRDNISPLALNAVKGLMCMDGDDDSVKYSGKRRIHIYGSISAGETPDRILFLDTADGDAEFTKVLDFGNGKRGETTLGTFKIKNNSASLEIFTIQITAEDLFLNAGGWYEFGDDGIAYQGTFSAGDLDFDEELLIYYKQVIPDGETMGVQAARILVSHASVS